MYGAYGPERKLAGNQGIRGRDVLRLVVNMKRSVDRWEKMQQQMKALQFSEEDFSRIDAVDGRKLSAEELNRWMSPLSSREKVDFPGQLEAGEVGCFLSHRKGWKQLLDSSEEWALIMEDDICISPKGRFFIENTEWIPKKMDLVQLHSLLRPGREVLISNDIVKVGNEFRLIRQIKPCPIGTQAYLINRKAASVALQLSSRISAPLDDFLFQLASNFRSEIETWSVTPAVVREVGAVSTIGRNRNARKKSIFVVLHPIRLWRKVKRWFLYRINTERHEIAYVD